MSGKSLAHGSGESYSGIVPAKQPNKSGQPPAEVGARGEFRVCVGRVGVRKVDQPVRFDVVERSVHTECERILEPWR